MKHLTFTELEIQIQSAKEKIAGLNNSDGTDPEVAHEKSIMNQRLRDLEEELEERREHLLK